MWIPSACGRSRKSDRRQPCRSGQGRLQAARGWRRPRATDFGAGERGQRQRRHHVPGGGGRHPADPYAQRASAARTVHPRIARRMLESCIGSGPHEPPRIGWGDRYRSRSWQQATGRWPVACVADVAMIGSRGGRWRGPRTSTASMGRPSPAWSASWPWSAAAGRPAAARATSAGPAGLGGRPGPGRCPPRTDPGPPAGGRPVLPGRSAGRAGRRRAAGAGGHGQGPAGPGPEALAARLADPAQKGT